MIKKMTDKELEERLNRALEEGKFTPWEEAWPRILAERKRRKAEREKTFSNTDDENDNISEN